MGERGSRRTGSERRGWIEEWGGGVSVEFFKIIVWVVAAAVAAVAHLEREYFPAGQALAVLLGEVADRGQ